VKINNDKIWIKVFG